MNELLEAAKEMKKCVEEIRNRHLLSVLDDVVFWKMGTPPEIQELDENPVWTRFCAAIEKEGERRSRCAFLATT